MIPMAIGRIASYIPGARLRGDAGVKVAGLSTDSRALRAGELFLALVGERFDGHDFVQSALERGAAAVVVERKRVPVDVLSRWEQDTGLPVPVIEVADTRAALGAIASGYIRDLGVTVIAVTGSTGKTTTKDVLAAMLGRWQPVIKSRGNENNEIGVPLTLLRADVGTRFAVVEMGMRGTGEIRALCAVAHPRVGVITNIGPAHVGRLGSIEAVAEAKAELIAALPRDGVAVLNADDPWSRRIAGRTIAPVLWYGTREPARIRLTNVTPHGLDGLSVEVMDGGARSSVPSTGEALREVRRLFVPLAGRHNAYNVAAAVAAARALGCPWDAIEAAAAAVDRERTGMRMEVVRCPGVTIINDAYNASPPSTAAALDTLASVPARRRVAVLGDMLELGHVAADAHREAGRRAAAAGVALLICVGEWARVVASGAEEGGLPPEAVVTVADSEQAALEAVKHVRIGDVWLVKGSRGVRLERVVAAVADSAGREGAKQ